MQKTETLQAILTLLVPIIVIIVIVSGAISVGIITFEPENQKASELVAVTVIIDHGTGDIDSYAISTINNTVLGCLLDAAEVGNFVVKTTYYGEFDSSLIDQIDGIENGEDDKYWQFYLNDEYATMGADKQIVKNEDIIKWKFEGFEY